MHFLFSLSCIAVLIGSANAAVAEDKVESLPGYVGELPSTHYSGYIPVGNLTNSPGHLHYWFIESENDPSTDPVILWLNGGPGSSSLIGLLTENGQVRTNDDSLENPIDGIPQLYYNPYTWTSMASVLYLESPKGVGFSYCDDAETSSDCVNTDESTALDAYEFLVNWFNSYPEYKANKFYITGESYAGIYIPMMMDQISHDPLGAKINMIGAAIGNGCWGTTVGTCAHGAEQQEYASEFFFGHGMYTQTLREEMLAACGDWSSLSDECEATLDEMNVQMGDFDVYNVYDTCGSDNRRRLLSNHAKGTSPKTTLRQAAALMAKKTVVVNTADSFTISSGYSAALNDYECGGHTAMDVYLAEPSVIASLHVKADTVGMSYQKTCGDLLPLYQELIDKYQMLIYAGDTDGCVPFVGLEKWTRGMNSSLVKDWHQWLSKPNFEHGLTKAGYAVTYDKFQFITVNGAGHMVPTFQQGFALEMFRKFLANEEF